MRIELEARSAGATTAPAARAAPPSFWTGDEWATPLRLVRELESRFGPFDLDPCCRPETAKAPVYFTKSDNGLEQRWNGRVFLNPPYSDPAPWLVKSIEETQAGRALVVVALLPAATCTGWFHELVLPHSELIFLRGRVRFVGWRGTPINRPKSSSIVAVYRAEARR